MSVNQDGFGWQRWVFTILLLAVVGAIFYGVHRYFSREVEAQEKLQAERTDKKNFQHIRKTIQDAADKTMPKDFNPFSPTGK